MVHMAASHSLVPARSAPALPPEMISNIMFYLADHPATVRSANLTSKLWHSAAQRWIFHLVRIRPYTLDKFDQLLTTAPVVGFWIRYLEVYAFRAVAEHPNEEPRQHGLDLLYAKWEQFGRVVLSGRLRNLIKLVFCECVFPMQARLGPEKGLAMLRMFEDFKIFDKPMILYVEDIEIDVQCFKAIAFSIPDLRTLHVVDVYFSDPDSVSIEDDDEETVWARYSNEPVPTDGIYRMSLGNLYDIRDWLPPLQITGLRELEVDSIHIQLNEENNYDSDTAYLLTHLGRSLKILRLGLSAYNAAYEYDIDLSDLTSLHTLELRPVTHPALPTLLTQIAKDHIPTLHTLEFPLDFTTLDAFKPEDYHHLIEPLGNFDPTYFKTVRFTYRGPLKVEDVQRRVWEMFGHDDTIYVQFRVVKVDKRYPFGTSYGKTRHIMKGLEKWRARVGPASGTKPTKSVALPF
ncbi:hypothetical protein BXZ70DRAFT_932398 [Cristinia sonorae]|uniref:F-box domain-containing protein n=1 Tax=Cristinia sonorae TaxID=1940300 RepID=A0A8K0UQM4_9AGAR|nr:hypothetical protein BXZ70DRAFT_932398 [Cristinia sonorae]